MKIDNRLRDDFEMAKAIIQEFIVNVPFPDINEVRVSGRMTRSLGLCRTRIYRSTGHKEVTITLSKYLFDKQFNRISRVGIMLHELLHAYFPLDRHRGNWKKYADMITNNSMFEISQYANEEDADAFMASQRRR